MVIIIKYIGKAAGVGSRRTEAAPLYTILHNSLALSVAFCIATILAECSLANDSRID